MLGLCQAPATLVWFEEGETVVVLGHVRRLPVCLPVIVVLGLVASLVSPPLASASAAAAPPRSAQASAPASYPETVLADGPLVYYRLGETSGSVAKDSSGHGVAGTYGSGAVQGVAGAIAGDTNAAVSGDGTMVTASASSLPAGKSARTLETWYKASDLSFNNWPIMSYGSGANQGIGLTFSTGDGSAAHAAAAVMGTDLLDAAIAAPVLEAGLTQANSYGEPAHTIWQAA